MRRRDPARGFRCQKIEAGPDRNQLSWSRRLALLKWIRTHLGAIREGEHTMRELAELASEQLAFAVTEHNVQGAIPLALDSAASKLARALGDMADGFGVQLDAPLQSLIEAYAEDD